jgi:hypothetical protein
MVNEGSMEGSPRVKSAPTRRLGIAGAFLAIFVRQMVGYTRRCVERALVPFIFVTFFRRFLNVFIHNGISMRSGNSQRDSSIQCKWIPQYNATRPHVPKRWKSTNSDARCRGPAVPADTVRESTFDRFSCPLSGPTCYQVRHIHPSFLLVSTACLH